VIEVLPLDRVRVNLGTLAGAREGMRFAVRGEGGPSSSRGEIVLAEVGRTTALAEILHLDARMSPPAPGDRLELLDEAAPHGAAGAGRQPCPLLDSRAFLDRLAQGREQCGRFALFLAHLPAPGDAPDGATRLDQAARAASAAICARSPGGVSTFVLPVSRARS